MAGGIYIEKPFSLNISCIVFAFTMIALYWLTARFSMGKPNYLMFPLIFIIAYVALAWYNYGYSCTNTLYSGKSGPSAAFNSIFKPQLRTQEHKEGTVANQERAYQKNIYLFHLLLVTPVLGYVGIQGVRGKLKGKDWYVILLVLALSVFTYHGYRFFKPRTTYNIIVDKEGNIKTD
jgi:hypothetical protein